MPVPGTEGNDYIYGDDHDDFLNGKGGDDRIYGGKGNDVAYGGAGADYVSGGDGNDQLYAGEGTTSSWGKDTLVGGNGNDVLKSLGLGDRAQEETYGFWSNRLDAGDGDDLVIDNTGSDLTSLGAGEDNLYDYGFGNDKIYMGKDAWGEDGDKDVVHFYLYGNGGNYISSGRKEIYDFELDTDKIQLHGIYDGHILYRYENGGVALYIGEGDKQLSIQLRGITAHELKDSWFISFIDQNGNLIDRNQFIEAQPISSIDHDIANVVLAEVVLENKTEIEAQPLGDSISQEAVAALNNKLTELA